MCGSTQLLLLLQAKLRYVMFTKDGRVPRGCVRISGGTLESISVLWNSIKQVVHIYHSRHSYRAMCRVGTRGAILI